MQIGSLYIDFFSIALVLVFLVCVIVGSVMGLFKMLISLAKTIVSLVVSIFLARPLGMLIYNIGIFNGFENNIANSLTEFNSVFSNVITEENRVEVIKEGLIALNIPSIFSSTIASLGEKYIPLTNDVTIAQYLSSTLVIATSILLAALLLFIAVYLVMLLLRKIMDSLDKIKIIGWINHLSGAIIGVAVGCIIVYVAMLGLSFLLTVPSISDSIASYIKLNDDSVWTLAEKLYILKPWEILFNLIGLS